MPKPQIKNNQTLYAFWDYDLCPYMLGGVIQGFLSSGNVKVKGYDGMSFKPIAILPDDTGRKALARLRNLQDQYRIEEKEIKSKYKELARVNVGLGGKE